MDLIAKIILVTTLALAFVFCVFWGYAEYVKIQVCSAPGFKPIEWKCGQKVFP